MSRRHSPRPATRASDGRAYAQLSRLLAGQLVGQAVSLVARLGVPDRLADGPRSATDLAATVGVDSDALYRVLRALVSVGVLAERRRRRFALTPVGRLLRAGGPHSLRAVAILAGEPWRAAAFALPTAVRTGGSAFERMFGMPFYDYLAQHDEQFAVFTEVMAQHWDGSGAAAVVAACRLPPAPRLIVDVGGGSGVLLARLLAACPGATGMLLELPAVGERARAQLTALGLAPRCTVVVGDFFETVPAGGDVYLLAFVLHNWDDARAGRLLRACRAALRPRARLLVVESLLPSHPGPAFSAIHDLEMLAFTSGGRERTEREYRRLFRAAGLRLVRCLPTRTSSCILEVVRGRLPRPRRTARRRAARGQVERSGPR